MTTPPILRIYRGMPAELAHEGDVSRPQPSSAAPLYAVAFSAAVHLLILVPTTFLAVLDAKNGPADLPGVPNNLLRVVFIAFILAQCGLGAILFARGSWSVTAKASIATLIFGGLWLMLVATMQPTRDDMLFAQAWAAGISVLVILVIVITSLFDLALHYENASARSRFGLLHLLAATTAIAIALGLARNIVARQGFQLADVFNWQFFAHVQLAGCMSAALAVATYASVRLPNSWNIRSIGCALVLLGFTIAAPVAFQSTFGNDAGATLTDMRWLFGTEGLFLLGTLVPLQMLSNDSHISK